MSYTKFKKAEQEFTRIFPSETKPEVLRSFKNPDCNLILSSESFVVSLEPILSKMLGGSIDNKKVVLIPNAGISSEKEQMSYQYLFEFTTIYNMYLKLLDIERWPKELILETLNSCDVISISGGMVSRLLVAIDKVDLRDEFLNIINSGKPFVGFSAGGMSLSDSTIFAEKYIGEPDPEVIGLQPLGIVNFEVYPHFEQKLLPEIKVLSKNIKEAYSIPHEGAIVITNGEVIGVNGVQRI